MKLPIGLILAFLLAACSPGVNVPATMPDDFALSYQWREGSLPPPYHYEYSIMIQSDGKGEVEMIPDYPSDETPIWTEPFMVLDGEMDRLYALLIEERFFQTNWIALNDPPVGGSSESLVVTAQDKEYMIPSFVRADQSKAASRIYAQIQALVPQSAWDQLEAQREQYMEEHAE